MGWLSLTALIWIEVEIWLTFHLLLQVGGQDDWCLGGEIGFVTGDKMKIRSYLIGLGFALTLACLCSSPAVAAGSYANPVTYSGQGLLADGFGGYALVTEICGVANGADVNGPYLLWVLTATGASKADITGPWGTASMVKSGGGTFKYVSGWYAPSTLPGNVSASYDGKIKNVQLTISHGCRPYTHGAWCSPGFWANAQAGAWTLIGISPSALFNDTVFPSFYDTSLGATVTLDNALNLVAYKSGTLTTGPYGLTPFNATGAFLTNNIPGYTFDVSFIHDDDSQTCPIDHFGNFKKSQ